MFGFVPNLLTLANLACGLLAIPFALQADTTHIAFQLIILSSVFDFFDGMAARALKVEGPLGMQLDSLADVVSFGVVPGLIWKSLMDVRGLCPPTGFCINSYVWMLIPLAAAYRLARFNVQPSGLKYFIGIPTPITGLVLASFSFISLQIGGFEKYQWGLIIPPSEILNIVYVWLYLPLLGAYLMVSEIPFLALKFNKVDDMNKYRLAFVLASVLMIVLTGVWSLAFIYILYILFSLLSYKGKTSPEEDYV